jgi:hypothetical protein
MYPSSSSVNGGCSSSSIGSASNCGRAALSGFFAGTSGLLPAGVGDGASDKHPASHVNERQSTGGGRLAQVANAFLNVGFHPIAALSVHVRGALRAFAVGTRHQAEGPASQQFFELGAWAVAIRRCRRCWLDKTRPRMARERRMVYVNRPLLAVSCYNAGQHFFKQIPALSAPSLQVQWIAKHYGSGLDDGITLIQLGK